MTVAPRSSPVVLLCLTLLVCALLLFPQSAFSLDPSLDISQYAHTSWKIRDGFLPGTVYAIAQTADGYLWLGTEFGLYRFDGVRAMLWQPPAGQQLPSSYISRLMVSRDGTLWVGTTKGLASWRNGQLTRYSEIAGHSISSLLEDHEGTVWVGEFQQQPPGELCAIRAGLVKCYGTDGSLGWGALTLFEDSKDNLWVGGGRPPKFALWRWKPGPPRLYATEFVRCFDEDSDAGVLVGTSSHGLMRLADGKLQVLPDALPRSVRGLSVMFLRRDREGGLWVGLVGGGLVHIHRGRTDTFTQSDGLSGDWVSNLFEDREGNIWVATLDGLDRFRNFTVTTWSQRQGLSAPGNAAVVAGNDGAIWSPVVRGLAKLDKGEVTIYRQRAETGTSLASQAVRERIVRQLPERFLALLQDHNGRLWISSPDSLGYLEGEQFRAIPHFGARVTSSLAEDPAGNLWVRANEEGLFLLRDGRMIQHIPWNAVGNKDHGTALAVDQMRGGLWIGFAGGGIVFLKDGQIHLSYSASDGLGQGTVNNLRLDQRDTLWAASDGGLSRIRDGRVETLTSKDGLPCDKVHWSIEDDDHFVWLYMPCGLVRVQRSELDAWASDTKRKVQSTAFDASDGVRTVAKDAGFSPRVSKAPDGKIWFSAIDGVSVIDPDHLAFNKIPPPVHVEQITADRKTYDAYFDVTGASSGKLRLPPLIRDLEVDYTALSLVTPEKVLFRYMLEGFDRDWQDAGNRRQAFYTNLPPRHYRFHVKACNNSGVWNEEGAALDFVIPPAWYQTYWFFAACVAAFLALFWALYQYRLHQLAQQLNMRLEERVGERTRIARDLHDTLLQSFHGILFFLQSGIHLLDEHPAEAKKTLNTAAEQAERAILEGREAVQGLRASTVERNDLAAAIKTLGGELAATDSSSQRPEFNVQVEGIPRNLHPILRDEVYRIAGEAMRNAFRHSDAKQIEVEIHYDERRVRVRVRDDGKGIDPKVLSDHGREGHYGLAGMRERAKLIGGKLTVWSELDSGTEVELSIPASRAYTVADGQRSWLAEKFAKLSGKDTELKS